MYQWKYYKVLDLSTNINTECEISIKFLISCSGCQTVDRSIIGKKKLVN